MSSSKEPLIYAQPQIEIIRNALVSGFHRGRRLYGESFNMMYFAAWIESRFEDRTDKELLQFPEEYRGIKEAHLTTSPTSGGRTDAFGRFLRGQSKRMSNIRMIACELYLTDPNCEFASLTRDDIYADKAQLAAPIYLAKFLNPHGVENNPLTTDLLHSDYDCISSEMQSHLALQTSSEPCILSVELKQEHYKAPPTSTLKEQWKTEEFTGWAVTTEEENIVVALKDQIENTVVLFNTIAIETNFYQGQKIGSFILNPFINPIPITPKERIDPDGVILEHADSILDSALIFNCKTEVA